MFGIGMPELIIVVLFILLPFIFWFWALVDILKSEFTGSNKIIWLLIVIFIPFLGFILYFLIGRKQKIVKT
ncbi:MAG: PLDc N-terminal domain-containing protein [Nitrospinae bacterium]|nr:PLDc N-terminal domain-containing protein [Nitrospinota bacterium]